MAKARDLRLAELKDSVEPMGLVALKDSVGPMDLAALTEMVKAMVSAEPTVKVLGQHQEVWWPELNWNLLNLFARRI